MTNRIKVDLYWDRLRRFTKDELEKFRLSSQDAPSLTYFFFRINAIASRILPTFYFHPITRIHTSFYYVGEEPPLLHQLYTSLQLRSRKPNYFMSVE